MTNGTKNITVMIYSTAVQYIKHRMQTTHERWEYNLTTNSVNFMQQTTSPVSKDDSSICN